jgi:hypothetical protein
MAYDYMLLGDVNNALVAIHAKHPTLCDVHDLPEPTANGRTPKYLRIGKSKVADVSVLITGGVHAREWAPPDSVVSLAATLLDHYEPALFAISVQAAGGAGFTVTTDQVKAIVERLVIYIIPIVNPDGRDFSLTPAPAAPLNPAGTPQISWRKNRSPQTGGIGVDINRNFGILWDYKSHYDPAIAAKDAEALRKGLINFAQLELNNSTVVTDDSFIGPSQESEPETRNVRSLLNQYNPRFVFDVHSYGRDILYPWGIGADQSSRSDMNFGDPAWDKTRDAKDGIQYKEFIPFLIMQQHERLAQLMQQAIQSATGTNYKPEPSLQLYGTTGALDDYSFSRGGLISPAFTIECGSLAEGGFWPTYTKAPGGNTGDFVKIEAEVHAALLRALVEIAERGGVAGWAPTPGTTATPSPITAPATARPASSSGGPPPPPPPPKSGVSSEEHKTHCSVKANGHCSRFLVRDADGLRGQVLFVASQPGVPASPVERDRVLVYKTITNEGPAAVRVYWDGSPADNYETPAQSALILPGNSLTVCAAQAIKVVYSPVPAGVPGDYAHGTDVVSWCCPKPFQPAPEALPRTVE